MARRALAVANKQFGSERPRDTLPPALAETHHILGAALVANGGGGRGGDEGGDGARPHLDEAIAAFRAALEIDPGFEDARSALAAALDARAKAEADTTA